MRRFLSMIGIVVFGFLLSGCGGGGGNNSRSIYILATWTTTDNVDLDLYVTRRDISGSNMDLNDTAYYNNTSTSWGAVHSGDDKIDQNGTHLFEDVTIGNSKTNDEPYVAIIHNNSSINKSFNMGVFYDDHINPDYAQTYTINAHSTADIILVRHNGVTELVAVHVQPLPSVKKPNSSVDNRSKPVPANKQMRLDALNLKKY